MNKGVTIGIVVVVLVVLVVVIFSLNGGDDSVSSGDVGGGAVEPSEGDVVNEVPAPGADDDVEEMIVVDGDESGEEDEEMGEGEEDEESEAEMPGGDGVVTVTSSGFVPSTLEISLGSSVTFVNEAGRGSWPATDVHPTHRSYPGSDISKCITSEVNDIFDACSSLSAGGSYTFTFNEGGEWNYHDHLSPGIRGKIVVS